MSKIFVGIITQNELENMKELTSCTEHFDGLAVTDHYSTDGTYELLKEKCGYGFVEQIKYFGNNSHSMNHFLFNPKIEIGDWILLRDSNERINPNFAQDIRGFVNMLESNQINTVYQYSKMLMFRRFSQQHFRSTPHWGFEGARPNGIQIEKTNIFAKDEDYCYSVRNRNRDKYHFVFAYLRYYLILDSNHGLLGIEKNVPKDGDVHKTFAARELIRIGFRKALIDNGYECSVDGVKSLMDQARLSGLPKWALSYFNGEKILNDAYRYYVLDLKDFDDNHDWNNIIKIE